MLFSKFVQPQGLTVSGVRREPIRSGQLKMLGEANMSSTNIEDVLQQELSQVETARKLRLGENPQRPHPKHNLVGLAFSGGGIRSATFNLGVLQALSQAKLLRAFDYMSTVSGGGYIGGWLMAWMRHRKIGIKEIEKELGSRSYSTKNAADPPELHFLRNYSNYLTPRKGLLGADFWAFVSTYLRNTILNQIILILLLLFVLLLPRTIVYIPNLLEGLEISTCFVCLAQTYAVGLAIFFAAVAVFFMGMNLVWVDVRSAESYPWYTGQFAIQVVIVIPLMMSAALVSYGIGYYVRDQDALENPWLYALLLGMSIYFLLWLGALVIRRIVQPRIGVVNPAGPAVPLVLITAAITGVLVGYLFIPFGKFVNPPPPPLDNFSNWHIFAFGTPLFVAIMLLAGTVHIGLMGRGMSDSHREWWARLAGWLLIYSIVWLFLFVMSIYVPVLIARLWSIRHPAITSGTLVWLVSTVYGVLFGKSKNTGVRNPSAPIPRKLLGYAARITPYIFILGLLAALSLLADKIALIVTNDPNCMYQLPYAFSGPAVVIACLVFLAAAFALSWRVNINEFSIHHAYRNRLVRCYLGASVKDRRAQPFTGFSDADDLPLSELQIPEGSTESRFARPLPILSTSLNVVRGKELALQTRKARSFAFTPLYAGFTREIIGGSEWQSAYAPATVRMQTKRMRAGN
jgi:hypothetical protein